MATADLVLLAAAVLQVPGRRLRALACGDDTALRDWIANESALRLAEARRDARLLFERIEAFEARLVALCDEEYPAGLRDLADPPPFLIARGTLGPARWREGTAIVGTRDAEPAAPPIVSGLARGVDAAAHEGALVAGVRTIAYVGHGLGATYPPEHRELEERIVAGGGAVLSEHLPGAAANRWSLMRRDRLQAAHAVEVVLVQSELEGGAMHALRFAQKLGRPRFALEPREGSGYDGNRRALADGASPLAWNTIAASDNVRARSDS